MTNRLNIPAELASLIERRSQADRRATNEGRTGEDRREENAAISAGVPTQPAETYALDGAAIAPPELLERRKDGVSREK